MFLSAIYQDPFTIMFTLSVVNGGIETGEQIGFDAILEYYDEMDNQEGADKAHLINKFMKENDLEDSYYIDLDW